MSDQPNTAPVRVSDVDVGRIVVESKHSFRVVREAYCGRHVHPNTLARIADAARRLGLPLPPGATASDGGAS